MVCESRTDAQGRMRCDVSLAQAGQVELIASARDTDGRVSQASTTVWVTRQGELWFGGDNHDRMDVLPEKRAYAPGDTARTSGAHAVPPCHGAGRHRTGRHSRNAGGGR